MQPRSSISFIVTGSVSGPAAGRTRVSAAYRLSLQMVILNTVGTLAILGPLLSAGALRPRNVSKTPSRHLHSKLRKLALTCETIKANNQEQAQKSLTSLSTLLMIRHRP